VSHLLEDRLTERAAGSLQRLFDSVPDTASIVEVDEGGAPRVATTQQVGCSKVAAEQAGPRNTSTDVCALCACTRVSSIHQLKENALHMATTELLACN
jgi:hypothetical protein